MDSKNRLIIVVAIVVLIVGAMFTSFGRNLFGLRTPEVTLPSTGPGVEPPGTGSGSDLYQRVEVTPRTVTDVVATLARPSSYYRELLVETFWGTDGTSSTQVQVWADDGWTHSRQVLPSGVARHDLTGGDTLYYWYEGSQQYETAPADDRSSDLAQHIPTYETVLALDAEEIVSAGYEARGELPCIFVEFQPGGASRLQRYWVSVDNGLLVSAETIEDGQIVYRMTAYPPVQSPCPADADFSLPDGTVLHALEE